MSKKPPKSSDIAAFGLTSDDYEQSQIHTPIWPCNQMAYEVFCGLSTQWRVSMGTIIGLDYACVFAFLNSMNLETDERNKLFADIQLMEWAALDAMSEDDN